MASEAELKQEAINLLYGMIRGRRKFSRSKGDLAVDILQELREAREDRHPPDWVQQMIAEEALEQERERKRKD